MQVVDDDFLLLKLGFTFYFKRPIEKNPIPKPLHPPASSLYVDGLILKHTHIHIQHYRVGCWNQEPINSRIKLRLPEAGLKLEIFSRQICSTRLL